MSTRHAATMRAVIKRRFGAPRERVFRAWTEAQHLQRWFFPGAATGPPPQVEVDLRVGGRYCITRYAADGTITAMVGGTYYEVQPPAKLVFSWAWEAPEADLSETLVTVEFHEADDATEIVVTHERIPAGPEEHVIGWICCLERLTQLVDTGLSYRITADPCRP